jgi:hypothetical protein
MTSKYEKIIEKVESGKLSKKELETLLKNATAKGGADDVIAACESMIASLPKSRVGSSARSSGAVSEKRDGYNIMASAINAKGDLYLPALIEVAEFHSKNNLITEISVLKTQIKLYYKGRHFTSGVRTKKGVFWVSCLDETKITDSTIENWKALGEIVGGTYFATRYVAVEVDDIDKLNNAFECVVFT